MDFEVAKQLEYIGDAIFRLAEVLENSGANEVHHALNNVADAIDRIDTSGLDRIGAAIEDHIKE